ncbi:VanZ family protein [Phycicoccus endophyticus]|uniref:VanZ family protein n=1 Tax=Phycicoccus endophyticus TaxID=1690220 RepID=A0A7G9R398_9MICO|nr:VanZ family protein [Phycicoccus endophyticus]NHI19817.1 VanZ family protein [Phycicoccus endophyticus]QNN50073.1 VanZ family protein [Phycicoccus endophyticus]GGL28348.1 hypothetical protein GCM10012283_08200 [Phycicoccus endophyticus]
MSEEAGGRAAPRAFAVLAVAALALQLAVVYAPTVPGPPAPPGVDKLVHAGVFLLPVLLGALAGGRLRWLVAGFTAHALLSEVVQASVLAHRDGDALDALADLAGVALGVLLARLVGRRWPSGAGPVRW